MIKLVWTIFLASCTLPVNGQASKIFTSDIDNFWVAYDSVAKLSDSVVQQRIIQELYLDKASRGLKGFMMLRQHTAARHLKNILRLPKFWTSLRPHTLAIENYREELQGIMERFASIYPAFVQPDIYFTIGCLNSGGTTESDRVLIGAEIAAADSTVDASELGNWLQKVFRDQRSIVYLVTHEIVHTQQTGGIKSFNLLTNCLSEGSADFIAEILMQKPVSSPYMTYGLANEKTLWEKFRQEMYGTKINDWLYNGSQVTHADLGYFMGYMICKSYYSHSRDKQKAIAEIIDLKYADQKQIDDFFKKSEYSDKWN